MLTGAQRIATERDAHLTREGWTIGSDARQPAGRLARAGACYAAHAAEFLARYGEPSTWTVLQIETYQRWGAPPGWPHDASWWKPKNPVRDLERAGAYMAAEIDREEHLRTYPSE